MELLVCKNLNTKGYLKVHGNSVEKLTATNVYKPVAGLNEKDNSVYVWKKEPITKYKKIPIYSYK